MLRSSKAFHGSFSLTAYVYTITAIVRESKAFKQKSFKKKERESDHDNFARKRTRGQTSARTP